MSQEIANSWDKFMAPWAGEFNDANKYGLSFEAECHFAKQILMKTQGVMRAAQANPNSFHDAIVNSSAIGISLNPAKKHAFLVPRDGAVCLDISFMGLVKLATDIGAIRWAKAELVYEGESFQWVNMTTPPHHDPSDPFADHTTLDGLRGGYCVAQLSDGSYLVDKMSAADILKVAASSKANNGPWKTWPAEMAKKTLIKRAYKSWPQGAGRERLDQAIHVINEHEGLLEIDNPRPTNIEAPPLCITHEQSEDLHAALRVSGLSEAQFCTKAGIQGMDSLPGVRYEGAKAFLQQQAHSRVRR